MNFLNFDGFTVGEEPETIFSRYLAASRLTDVRANKERIIGTILLGERMERWEVYDKGSVYAVGKYNKISTLISRKIEQIRVFMGDFLSRLRNVFD